MDKLQLTSRHLFKVRALLKRRQVDPSPFRDSFLERRIQSRMLRLQLDLDAYLKLLASEEEEVFALARNLSIAVSRFFRNPRVFSGLEPWLEKQLQDCPEEEGVRLLSAGCSTGEEPYSLALLGFRACPDRINKLVVEGVDRDPKALAKAQLGLYPKHRVSNVKTEELEEFFILHPRGYRVRNHLRRMVSFREHDLTQPLPEKSYDLIMLRNVLIYFRDRAKAALLQNLVASLKPSGRLVLGRIERIQDPGNLGLMVVHAGQRIYQREGP